MSHSPLDFPTEGYVGIAAEFAEAYSKEYESPKEFFYLDFLICLSVLISGHIRVGFGSLQSQPRLYGLKIGKSGWARKSTSTRIVEKFLKSALHIAEWPTDDSIILPGVGSAEGLANAFQSHKRILLSFDEFRRFEKKAGIEGSTLLSMMNELFEKNDYTNYTKNSPLSILDAHLGFLANTTDKTFENMVNSSELIDTGFMNRVLMVSSDKQKRIPMPKEPSPEIIESLTSELVRMLRKLQSGEEQILSVEPDAEELWCDWYMSMEISDASTRLDGIGIRLMALFAFVCSETSVSVKTLRAVLAVLNHQLELRKTLAPIDGANPMARMEQKIMAQLRKYPEGLTKTALKRLVNYSRAGRSVFSAALKSLTDGKEVKLRREKNNPQDIYIIVDEETDIAHQLASGTMMEAKRRV